MHLGNCNLVDHWIDSANDDSIEVVECDLRRLVPTEPARSYKQCSKALVFAFNLFFGRFLELGLVSPAIVQPGVVGFVEGAALLQVDVVGCRPRSRFFGDPEHLCFGYQGLVGVNDAPDPQTDRSLFDIGTPERPVGVLSKHGALWEGHCNSFVVSRHGCELGEVVLKCW